MFMFSIGGWGSRKLSLVAPDHTGYTGKIVKAASQGGKSPLYIAPIQDELNTTPLQLSNDVFSDMPKAMCQKCRAAIPLQLLMEHLKSCNIIDVDNDEDNLDNVEENCKQGERQCKKINLAFSIDLTFNMDGLKIKIFDKGKWFC